MIEVKHLPPFSVWKRWAGTIFVISLLVFSALVFVFSMLCCTLDESASAGGMNDIKMISGMTYLVCFVSAILKYSTRENLIVFVSFLMMLLVSAIRALARER
jgi:FtsH-binding integral membrane protein